METIPFLMFHLVQHEKHNLSPKHKTFKKISLDFLVSAKNIYVLLIRYELCSRDNLIICGAKSCISQYLDKVLCFISIKSISWAGLAVVCLADDIELMDRMGFISIHIIDLYMIWLMKKLLSFSLRTELFFTKTQEVNQYIALKNRMK